MGDVQRDGEAAARERRRQDRSLPLRGQLTPTSDLAAPFLPISGYLASTPERSPALVGEARADVAIVGGGFSGLSAALALRHAGVDVVVLEREFCGVRVFRKPAPALPPEPFLWLTARGLLGLFGAMDRVTDAQIRRR